jgi:hemerythrin superfamily protein
MQEYLDHLKKDHQRLLQLSAALDAAISADLEPAGAFVANGEVRELLAQLIALLNAHEKLEEAEVFPALRARLPETERWQIKMVEIQDEAILTLAKDLHGWSTGEARFPREWVQENVARLHRWLQEHAVIEEERLFPRLSAPP